MAQRANLLVAELLDTELIGEGAIDTYTHARDYLLTVRRLLGVCRGITRCVRGRGDLLRLFGVGLIDVLVMIF